MSGPDHTDARASRSNPAPAPSGARRFLSRTWLGRATLAVFVVGGILLWQAMEPTEVDLIFEVPPMLRLPEGSASASVPREELDAVTARVYDEEAQLVATVDLALGGRMRGPLTPSTRVSLPKGRYVVRATFSAGEGARAERMAPLVIEGSGAIRVVFD